MAVLRVIEPFAFSEKNGVQRVMRAGDLVDHRDPMLKGKEHFFEPVEVNVERTTIRKVEQATAEPGETRDVKSDVKGSKSGNLPAEPTEAEAAGPKSAAPSKDQTVAPTEAEAASPAAETSKSAKG